MSLILVSLFGSIGAVGRFTIDGSIRSRLPSTLPWATMFINVSGSFLAGAVTGLVANHGLSDTARIAVGTGFCGGYTTFSTTSFETVNLLSRGERIPALVSWLGTLGGTLAAAAAGFSVAAL